MSTFRTYKVVASNFSIFLGGLKGPNKLSADLQLVLLNWDVTLQHPECPQEFCTDHYFNKFLQYDFHLCKQKSNKVYTHCRKTHGYLSYCLMKSNMTPFKERPSLFPQTEDTWEHMSRSPEFIQYKAAKTHGVDEILTPEDEARIVCRPTDPVNAEKVQMMLIIRLAADAAARPESMKRLDSKYFFFFMLTKYCFIHQSLKDPPKMREELF